MVRSCGGCIFWEIFWRYFYFILFLVGVLLFFVCLFYGLDFGGYVFFCSFFLLKTSLVKFLCHFYTSLPTVELSSSTTSTFLSLYSTLKSSIRGCLSTICLDGTTWRNAEDEEGVEEPAAEWLVGPYAGPCKVSPPYSLKHMQIRRFE